MRKVVRKDLGINGSDRSRDGSNAQSILSSAASSAFICREATYRQASANKCSRQEPYDASLFETRKMAFQGHNALGEARLSGTGKLERNIPIQPDKRLSCLATSFAA